MRPTPRTAQGGFTLVELLVVLAIVGLITVAALPVVLPALNERRVSESARILQATLAGARDAAIRANAPRGIRLLPDPILQPDGGIPGVLAYNRFVPIEPAPNYSEGVVSLSTGNPFNANTGLKYIYITELKSTPIVTSSGPVSVLNNPTSWYWNIRQGDKVRFSDSGTFYTVAGPIAIGPHPLAATAVSNPERFINVGPPAAIAGKPPEYLILLNGLDDDGDGYVDEAFDGLDNDGDGIIDPSFNGLDDDRNGTIDDEYAIGEYEQEVFEGSLSSPFPFSSTAPPINYVIVRRPVVSPNSAETTLPNGVVIDATTWTAPMVTQGMSPPGTVILQPERSRLPIDPYTYYVDILVSPGGQVVQGGAGGSNGDYNSVAPQSSQPFYHFWITEREGVVEPMWGLYGSVTNKSKDALNYIPKPNPGYGAFGTSQNYLLPMPKGTPNYNPDSSAIGSPFLQGERRLVTLFVKTGQIVSNSIESFNGFDTNSPYYDAQAGIKESQ